MQACSTAWRHSLARSPFVLPDIETMGITSSLRSIYATTPGKVLKRLHYPLDVMLLCVRWYVAYPLSLRCIDISSSRSVSLRSV